MTAGIYARVSASDQDPTAQVEQLRMYCRARELHEYVDHGVSGAAATDVSANCQPRPDEK